VSETYLMKSKNEYLSVKVSTSRLTSVKML